MPTTSSVWVQTSSSSYVSRSASLPDPKLVVLGPRCIVEPGAEVMAARMGGRVRVRGGAKVGGEVVVSVGACSEIGEGVEVRAAKVGSHCKILGNVGEGAILGDCVLVLPGAKVVDDGAVRAGSVIDGDPGLVVGEVPDWWRGVREREADMFYEEFRATVA